MISKNKISQSEQLIILLQSTVNVIQQVVCQTKIFDQQLQTLNNKADVSKRRFGLSQARISRHLKKQTSVRIQKRRSAPKYKNEDQQQRAKFNCLKVYKKKFPDCQSILDDKQYLTLSGDIPKNSRYYSSAPINIKFKQKYEPHSL